MRGTSHWLGQRLAQRGYTVLAFQTRASGFRGIVQSKLEDIPQDIAAWVDLHQTMPSQPFPGTGVAADTTQPMQVNR